MAVYRVPLGGGEARGGYPRVARGALVGGSWAKRRPVATDNFGGAPRMVGTAAAGGRHKIPRARSIPRALKPPRRRAAPSAAPRSHQAAPLPLRAVPSAAALLRLSNGEEMETSLVNSS